MSKIVDIGGAEFISENTPEQQQELLEKNLHDNMEACERMLDEGKSHLETFDERYRDACEMYAAFMLLKNKCAELRADAE